MRADKFTLTITCQALSLDTLPGLLNEVSNMINSENLGGALVKSDGDNVEWGIKSEPVEF